ncbi:hypothetical protein SDC9_167923 [bioreactor metagenome]|uniref:Uncharacterized protein n=1 Tax=bioreactor metagenome TaxID=1076179 RepID=A0A645G8Y5_9ZZZZ
MNNKLATLIKKLVFYSDANRHTGIYDVGFIAIGPIFNAFDFGHFIAG